MSSVRRGVLITGGNVTAIDIDRLCARKLFCGRGSSRRLIRDRIALNENMSTVGTKMPEEIFDVVDQNDQVLFQSPRSVVHANHWLHRAVHIFVFNSKGELLVHRRSATKDEAPLKLTSSASGHLSAGEDYATAAVRELEEELGLKANVQYLGVFPANGAETSFEHSGLYLAQTDETPIFDPEEILSGEFYSLDELQKMIDRDPDDFTHCFRSLFHWYLQGFQA